MRKSTTRALEAMINLKLPETIPNLLVQISRDGFLLDLIPAAPPYSELKLELGIGQHLSDLAPREVVEKTLAIVETALDTGSIQKHESLILNNEVNAPIVWYVPMRDDTVMALVLDQSERLQSEKEIRELNRALLRLQSAASAISEKLNLTYVLNTFTRELKQLIHAREIVILELAPDRKTLDVSVVDASPCNHELSVGQRLLLRQYPRLAEALQKRVQTELAADSGAGTVEDLLLRRCGFKSILVVPLLFQDQLLGAVLIGTEEENSSFAEEEQLLAQLLANQAAAALVNARLFQDSQQNLLELQTLNKVTQQIGSTLDLQSTLMFISESAQNLLSSQAAMIALLDDETEELEFVSFTGDRASHLLGERMPVDRGLMGWVVRHGQPLLNNDVPADPRYYGYHDDQRGARTHSVVAAPLHARGHCIGVMAAIDRVSSPFTEEDLRRLSSLAIPAATAIENANLYARAHQEIEERRLMEAALAQEREELASRVAERTRALTLANEELTRASRMKGEFLASMSHELRTPLNAILGLSEGLLEGLQGPVDEQQARSLTLIEKSGRRLLAMIDDILDVAKIGSGRVEITPEIVRIGSVCQASLQFARTDAGKKQIRLSSEIPETPQTIFADSRRLKQALANLLNNAVKFTPAGGEVGLRVTADAAHVHFQVWDTGIGIAPDQIPYLFQPFVQLDSSLDRRFDGTGLGLHLVQRIAALHDGDVSVASTPGKGSTFTISLPIKANSHEHRESVFIEDEETWAESVPGAAKILIAEDDDVNRTVYSDFLNMHGFRVIHAHNGLEAVSQCRQEAPDLILMDINMPGLSGLEAIRRIRKLPARNDVPIVALTAMAMSEDRQACLDAGANEYLCKPVPLRKIVALVEAILEERSRGSEG